MTFDMQMQICICHYVSDKCAVPRCTEVSRYSASLTMSIASTMLYTVSLLGTVSSASIFRYNSFSSLGVKASTEIKTVANTFPIVLWDMMSGFCIICNSLKLFEVTFKL